MSKFDELKKLAELATPGPWKSGMFGGVYLNHAPGCEGMEYGGYGLLFAEKGDSTLRNSFNNEAYVAAANPSAILELLAIQAQLVAALKELTERAMGFNVSGIYFGEMTEDRVLLDNACDALDAVGAKP